MKIEKLKRENKQWIDEGAKLSLYADDMILYIENPKDSTQKLLEHSFRRQSHFCIPEMKY